MKIRITILESKNSTEYLVDKVITTKESPRAVVNRYLKRYSNVHCIQAEEVTLYKTNRYSISTCLR